MSKHETPTTRWYWPQVGGTLSEEFVAVEGTSQCGRGVLDGLVILDGEFRITPQSEVSLAGKDVIVIQTKASRLGMYLMGQAFFSAQLIQRFNPHSVVSVALCSQDDAVLRPLLEQCANMKVVVCSRSKMASPPTAADGGTAVLLSSVAPSEVRGGSAPAAERERWVAFADVTPYGRNYE